MSPETIKPLESGSNNCSPATSDISTTRSINNIPQLTTVEKRKILAALDAETAGIFESVLSSDDHSHLIYGLCGTGKSVGFIKAAIVHESYDHIIMCKNSNSGCKELVNTLIAGGHVLAEEIELNLSVEQRLGDLGYFSLPKRKKAHAYDYERLADTETLVKTLLTRDSSKTEIEIRELLEECHDHLPKFSSKKITVMTQARYLAMQHKFHKSTTFDQKKTLVIIDDALVANLTDYKKFNPDNDPFVNTDPKYNVSITDDKGNRNCSPH